VPVGALCGAYLGTGSKQHLGKVLLLATEPGRRHGDAERRDAAAGVADLRANRGDTDRELFAIVGHPHYPHPY
jgi:hypothetical protein